LPGWEKQFAFDKKVPELGPNTYLQGFWQSPKYFEEYENVIRKDFTLKNMPDNIERLAREIQSQASLCVHVRRGDYVRNKLHDVVGQGYYKKGIDYIKSKTNIDKIYIFSDDRSWCEDNLHFDISTMYIGDGYAGEAGEGNIYLMSQCKNFIIPNSTFSWWGAWLSNFKDKIVVCPKRWFNDLSINTDDLMPRDWVRI